MTHHNACKLHSATFRLRAFLSHSGGSTSAVFMFSTRHQRCVVSQGAVLYLMRAEKEAFMTKVSSPDKNKTIKIISTLTQ